MGYDANGRKGRTGRTPLEHEVESVSNDPGTRPVDQRREASSRALDVDRKYLYMSGEKMI